MAVFINYRREDSEGDTRALYNRLAHETDERSLFLDFETIAAGDNWHSRIDDTLEKVQAVLVVIGPRWLDILKARAAAPGADLVRSEIAACLSKPGVRVVPVLVNGAGLPAADSLPEDIRGLVDRNAIEVRGSAWNADVDRLVKTLRRAGALPTSRRSWILRSGVALAGLALLAGGFAMRVEVPNVPKDMSYKYAQALIESHGLRFQGHKITLPGERPRIDVVTDQRPAGGSTIFRGQAVEVDLVASEFYTLVCRGGGPLSATAAGDILKFERHSSPASREMKEGSCAWMDRAIRSNEPSDFRPLGFKEELPAAFRSAPGGFLAFCAHLDPTTTSRFVAVSYEDYMIIDGNGQLQPRFATFICVEPMP
jgi:TIR domain